MNQCTCHTAKKSRVRPFTINAAQQRDPTRTLSLRRQFSADMTRRFNMIKRLIRESIVINDAFGLTDAQPIALQAAGRNDFAFRSTEEKVRSFMTWLQAQEAEQILEITRVSGALTRGIQRPWTDVYIQSAYQKGIQRSRIEMNKAGFDVPTLTAGGEGALEIAMNGPIHADRAGLAFSRTFTELEGITRAMDQQISRVLAQGLIDGKNPRELARQINDRVDKIGLTRAKTLARTEVISAHHQAMMQEYRAAGVAGVSIQAEWLTAGDDRVCAECAALEGKIFTLDEIQNLIPLHPNCRCIALPIDVDDPEQVADAASRREEAQT